MCDISNFDKLASLNLNGLTEKKKNLTYLSWAHAWKEFSKIYPNATYTVKKDDNGLPYFGTEEMGYMVFVEVTADSLTHEMWLPVMNGANKAMKNDAYAYTTQYGDKTVEAISMFDINKTIMRCLVKALAMFGLGLYIYAGEDLPENIEEKKENDNKKEEVETEEKENLIAMIRKTASDNNIEVKGIEKGMKVRLKLMGLEKLEETFEKLERKIKRNEKIKKEEFEKQKERTAHKEAKEMLADDAGFMNWLSEESLRGSDEEAKERTKTLKDLLEMRGIDNPIKAKNLSLKDREIVYNLYQQSFKKD